MNNHIFCLVFFSIALSSTNGFSQWNANTAVNTAVCISSKNQQNLNAVSDGMGGAIIAWEDSRSSSSTQTDIYVQRIDKNGVARWTLGGVTVCNDPFDQSAIDLVADDKGGAILVWGDTRNGKKDIYAQKVDSIGTRLWASNGVAVCMKAGAQSAPKIISDGAGGGIVVWEDSLTANPDIYAQHIDNSGAVTWTAGGVSICSNALSQNNPRITSDSAGGAIIAWQDFRNGNDYDIYAQRINSSGAVQWTAQGVGVCKFVGTQNNPKVKPDGSNGAIVTWADKRGLAHDVYAQRLDGSGTVLWTANGVIVCNASGSQSAISMTTSGINGAIIAWKDQRSGSYEDIYAQKINLNGTVAWAANGIAIATGALSQKNVAIAGDGSGGAIMVWQDSSAAGWDIYAQKVDVNGIKQWASVGVPVGTAADDQTLPDNVSDGNGGCIFVWQDKRNTTDQDIYAHHLFSNGIADGIAEQNLFLESKCFPNPFSVSATIEIPGLNGFKGDISLRLFNVLGEKEMIPYQLFNDKIAISGGTLKNGIYLYEISKGDVLISKGRLILVETK